LCPYTIEGATPEKRDEIRTLLPQGNAMDDPARLNASIDGLRRLGLSQTSIVNHLIGAYCPTVAQEGALSDAEKTAKVRQFASRITALVHREEDISEFECPLEAFRRRSSNRKGPREWSFRGDVAVKNDRGGRAVALGLWFDSLSLISLGHFTALKPIARPEAVHAAI
jgi:hypothetical protein